ncbi:MAG: tryptophan 7-halogenase [Alphaproteobacteria bacterium]|nr:tryptophan 7-halogenase [Alphaproteobacteria bacterium]
MNARSLDTDVVILGGGLAGLSLANQLVLARPGTQVTVVEKATFPLPEAAHKVGESTVEIAALYFGDVLGLRQTFETTQLPKLGLRFFFGDGRNDDIAVRPELGPTDFMPVRSWQLDRGRAENQLAALATARGVTLVEGAKVTGVTLDGDGHTVSWTGPDGGATARTRWVVDASGRRAFLKKQLGLMRTVPHDTNAAWFRVPSAIDLEQWSTAPSYTGWTRPERRLSTNHLLGPGYWVWLIPLASGSTSVGIVVDEALHPFSSLRTEAGARAWLRTHEPQCADAVEAAGAFQDFLVLKHYSHSATRVFSPDRWGLVGDAGVFLDPFYSPGSDFIAMGNTMLCDGICADLDGLPDAADRIEAANQRMLTLYRGFLPTYRGRYPMMGRPVPMRAKVVWDFAFYWSSWALLFANRKVADHAFLARAEPVLRKLFAMNIDVQALLTRWADVAAPTDPAGSRRFDYSAQPWLRALNAALLSPVDDDALLTRLQDNLTQLTSVAAELVAAARSHAPDQPELVQMAIDLPSAPDGDRMGWLALSA